MRVLAVVRVSSQYCECMDDSLMLSCSVDDRTLYTDEPPSPFNRVFLVDSNALQTMSFRDNRFPTAWAIWNRDTNFSDWLSFMNDLRQREFYINYFKKYDFLVKVDDDILIKTKFWDRLLVERMNSIGPNCVSLGASAFTSSNLVVNNHSKLVMYRTSYILQADPIKLEPDYMHPLVMCEVLSNPDKPVVAPIGRILVEGITNVVS